MRLLIILPMLASIAVTHAQDADVAPPWSVDAAYAGEMWTVDGRGASSYIDNLDLAASIDAEQLFGVRDVQLFARGLYNNGHALEGAETLQGVSNIEAVRAWRLYEAWAQWQFAPTSSLLAGLYDLNSEFDSIETASLFINPSHGIGADIAQTGANGPSIFPNTSAAIRLQAQSSSWHARLAVLDAVSGDVDHPDHTTVQWNADEGLLYAFELNYSSEEGARTGVGYWQYSKAVRTLSTDARATNEGMYLFIESAPLRLSSEHGELRAFTRNGWANDDVNAIARYSGAGIVWTGFVPGREDQLGVSLAHASIGSPWREAARDEGHEPHASETILEVSARIPLGAMLSLQPDIQYVRHPGAAREGASLWVYGVRFEMALSYRR